MMKTSFIFSLLLLTACVNQGSQNNSSQSSSDSISRYIDKQYGYEIIADFNTPKGDWSSRNTAAGKTIHSLWNGHLDDGQDVFVDIYHPESSCSSQLTGTSKTTDVPNTNAQTTWGRVDVWDNMKMEGWEYPSYHEQILCKKDGIPAPKEAYALCSEKDEKTVVICMTQQTDNPTLAKEIFESFRWTE